MDGVVDDFVGGCVSYDDYIYANRTKIGLYDRWKTSASQTQSVMDLAKREMRKTALDLGVSWV